MTPHRERGIVRGTEGDAVVVVIAPSDEARCRTCGACGGSGESMVHLPNTLDLEEGDEIVVDVETPSALTSALLVFALPFAGAGIGYVLSKGGLALFGASASAAARWVIPLACGAGFVSSFAVSAWWDRRWRRRHGNPVTIVGVERKTS